MSEQDKTVTIDFFDVKRDLSEIIAGGKIPAIYAGTNHASRLREYAAHPEREDRWIGGSAADTVRWMKDGFKAKEFRNAGRYVKDAAKRRRTYNDLDGNLNLDRLYSGEEKFFEKKVKRTAKPGMTINVEYAFAAMVNAEDIQKYGAWVAGFCGSLEKQGYDLEVNVDSILDGLFRGDRGRITTRCIVKKRGQKSRFHSWSCLFSPTGYRHIMFHAYHVAGAKIGKTPNSSLGMTIGGRKWAVEYDKDSNTVTIRCNQRAKVDLDTLNADAKAAGLI